MGGRSWVGVLHDEAACRPPAAADADFHGFLSVVLRPVAHVPRGCVINSHGLCLIETMVKNEGAVSSPQLQSFTVEWRDLQIPESAWLGIELCRHRSSDGHLLLELA